MCTLLALSCPFSVRPALIAPVLDGTESPDWQAGSQRGAQVHEDPAARAARVPRGAAGGGPVLGGDGQLCDGRPAMCERAGQGRRVRQDHPRRAAGRLCAAHPRGKGLSRLAPYPGWQFPESARCCDVHAEHCCLECLTLPGIGCTAGLPVSPSTCFLLPAPSMTAKHRFDTHTDTSAQPVDATSGVPRAEFPAARWRERHC